MRPKLFIFDADGTLRWTHIAGQRYPLSGDEWSLMPNVEAIMRAIPWAENGPWLSVVSNQSGVGEGLLDAASARQMLEDTVWAAVGYRPSETEIEMCVCRDNCDCQRKKPNPGMLLSLLDRFSISPAEALYVGDQQIDAEAACRAGVPFRWATDFFAALK